MHLISPTVTLKLCSKSETWVVKTLPSEIALNTLDGMTLNNKKLLWSWKENH